MSYSPIKCEVEIVGTYDNGYDIAVNGHNLRIGHQLFHTLFIENVTKNEVRETNVSQADVVVNEIMESFDIKPAKITKTKKKASK